MAETTCDSWRTLRRDSAVTCDRWGRLSTRDLVTSCETKEALRIMRQGREVRGTVIAFKTSC